jgi:N6-L-threonylcarbamoyladenine synthase
VPEALLAIETSCDETSAAVLIDKDGTPALSSLVVLSQDVHKIFGGVVPELASRAHLSMIDAVVDRTLEDAGINISEIDSIAVTAGPGLLGSLLVGVCYAKALALAGDKKIIGVNHLEGHVFAPTLEHSDLEPPFVALLISGGHTMLLDVAEWGRYRLMGRTRDDAAGEAFDKVASLLGLEYPGGPHVERVARDGEDRFELPRPMLNKGLDFSFSGLKTAVLYAARKCDDLARDQADLAASFQQAAFDVLLTKTLRALEQTGYNKVVFGGGVACSTTLKELATETFAGRAEFYVASQRLNTDNAAMIGRAGWFHLEAGREHDHHLDADARFPWPGLC